MHDKTGLTEDGSYQLEVPYGEDWEFIQDILKQGADVEVLEPQSLKTKVKAVIQSIAGVYGMEVSQN